MKNVIYILAFSLVISQIAFSQSTEAPSFRSVVEERLKKTYQTKLSSVCPIDTDIVAERVFRDYGAIFVSNNGGRLPAKCIFDSEAEVQLFQQSMNPEVTMIGGVQVTLQKEAMSSLLSAREEALKMGLAITPRGGASSSTRSYGKTTDLWNSRFLPGLNYWARKGRIRRDDAILARKAPIRKQVEMVLAWEQEGIYFSKDLSKSILYSVAAPGASQHIFMLALDVEQFANKRVRQLLAKHGWFQTVKSDLPHFTYLGIKENALQSVGLESVSVNGQTFWIPKM